MPAAAGLLLVLASVLAAPAALAQGSGSPGTPPAPGRAGAASDSTLQERYRLADTYLRAGQAERAIALLEDLVADAPEQGAFYHKLVEAYESVKRYDDAIALVERRNARRGPQPTFLAEKARLLYLKGDEAAARAAYDEALALDPGDPTTYRVVYRSLLEQRRFEQAVDVLERGRKTLRDTSLFRTDIAYLYSLTGDHRPAAREYVALLAQTEEQAGFVQRRLSPFIEQDDARDASIAVFESAVREAPLVRAYRDLLGWLYLEAERYREAFTTFRAIDRLEQENGGVLYSFAQRAADAEAYDVALESCRLILERYPEAAVAPETQRAIGDLHRRWAHEIGERATGPDGERVPAPHYDSAAVAYRTFLSAYPTHPAYPSVLRALGGLQQDVFLELGEAEATLKEVASRYPDSPAADEARYDLGRLAVMRGDLAEARIIFGRLVDRLRTGDLAEQARYELALLHFYQGEFEAALTRVEATNRNTSMDVANDAIALKMMLRMNRGPDSTDVPLRLYAEARLKARQRRPAAARTALDTLLAAHGAHPLADEARFLRAEQLRAEGAYDEAARAFAELSLTHPQSPLADRALFAAATLYADPLADLETAVETLNRLLEQYPDSLLAAQARARIRSLWREEG